MRWLTPLGLSFVVALAAAPAVAEDRKPDVRYVPTPPEVVEKMLEVARITRKDVVYDLGCGDGRIVIAAAKKYRCRAVGFDIDPDRIKDCEKNRAGLPREVRKLLRFEKKDVFKLDLSEATVVMLYLRPELNVKLIPQLQKLKAGSRIVSHNWDMKGVTPDDGYPVKVKKKDGYQREVYRWTTPLKREEDVYDAGSIASMACSIRLRTSGSRSTASISRRCLARVAENSVVFRQKSTTAIRTFADLFAPIFWIRSRRT